MSKLLTTAALDEWLARWRKLGVRYVDAWRPELTDEQIDTVAGEHGVTLSPPSAPSLGTLVQWWSSALDEGIHRWDRQAGHWDDGPTRPPEDQRLTGLV